MQMFVRSCFPTAMSAIMYYTVKMYNFNVLCSLCCYLKSQAGIYLRAMDLEVDCRWENIKQ